MDWHGSTDSCSLDPNQTFDHNEPSGGAPRIRECMAGESGRSQEDGGPQPGRWQAWYDLFLEAVRDTGIVRRGMEAARKSRSTVYRHREAVPAFRIAWDDSIQDACDDLEQEAWRRARKGVPELILHQGQIVRDEDGNPLVRWRYSDSLMMFVLKRHRPEFRDNYEVPREESEEQKTARRIRDFLLESDATVPSKPPAEGGTEESRED